MSVREAIFAFLRSRGGEARIYDIMEHLLDLAFKEKKIICLKWVAWEENGKVVHWCTGAAEELARMEREGLIEIRRDGHNMNMLVKMRVR